MRLDWLTRIILRLRGRLAAPYGPVAVLTSSGAGAPAPQLKRQPDGAELLRDVAPARWIAERLQRSTRQTGTLVGCVIPEGFEAYARIFHPARQYNAADRSWTKVRWSTVASRNGKVVHPQMEFSPIANLDPLRYDSPSWGARPRNGMVPEEECGHLVGVLGEFTTTPKLVYFAVWEGYGGLDARLGRGAAKLASPHLDRAYYIFRGPLYGVLSFYEWTFFHRSPNIWWPEDRAWCVASEIDFATTLVGGSAACIERVLAHPELEALPIAIDARVDAFGDTINV